MKKYILAACIVLSVSSLSAQERKVTVQGSVVDSASGERIPYATVMVDGTTIGTTADINGYFVLRNVSPEGLVLRISAVGYEPRTLKFERITGSGMTVELELGQAPKALPGVTITGRRNQGPAGMVSSSVITSGEMQKNVGAFKNDMVQMITQLPGVVTVSGVSSQYFVRGGGADQNLVLIDGMYIYNLSHAFGLFSFVEPLIVKAATFSAGGFQAEYGGRLSSVFDIQTRDGDNRTFRTTGTIDLLSSDISVSGPISKDNSSFLLYYRRPLSRNMLNRFYSIGMPFDFYDGFGKVTTNFAGTGHISLEFLTSADRINPPNPFEPGFEWTNNCGAVSGNYLFGDQFNMQIGIAFSSYKAEQFPNSSNIFYRQISEVVTPSIFGSVTSYTSSRNEFAFGFTFNFPTYSYTFTNLHGSVIDLSETQVEPDVWAKYNLKILPDLSIEAGLRSDLQRTMAVLTHEGGGYLTEPRLSISWYADEAATLYGAFGIYHQRIVDLNDENMVFSPFELIAPIGEGYGDEKSSHFIIGLRMTPSPVTELRLEVYRKTFSGLIAVNRSKVYDYESDFFAGDGDASGADVTLRYDVEKYYLEAAYSYCETTRKSMLAQPSGFSVQTYSPRYDLRHQLNLSAGWQPSERLWVRARWKITSGLPYTPITGFYGTPLTDPYNLGGYVSQPSYGQVAFGTLNSARLAGYQSLDVSASYDVEFPGANFTLTGTVINLYNKRNVFYINNVTGGVVYQLPTMVNVSLGWEI